MEMEKILKRDDGSSVKITVRLVIDYYRVAFYYTVRLHVKGKLKRKWISVKEDGHGSLDTIYAPYSNYVTDVEILEVKVDLWKKMNPEALQAFTV